MIASIVDSSIGKFRTELVTRQRRKRPCSFKSLCVFRTGFPSCSILREFAQASTFLPMQATFLRVFFKCMVTARKPLITWGQLGSAFRNRSFRHRDVQQIALIAALGSAIEGDSNRPIIDDTHAIRVDHAEAGALPQGDREIF